MHKRLVKKILALYGLELVSVLQVDKGYRNYSHIVETAAGETYNLILYKQEPDILAKINTANMTSDFLAARGLPTRQTLTSLSGGKVLKLQGRTGARYACLYTYLDGATIPWEAYTQKHIKLLGKALSDLHYLLTDLTSVDKLPLALAQLHSQFVIMQTYFAEPGVQTALQAKLQVNLAPDVLLKVEGVLKSKALASLPSQVLHLDFVRSNILFGEERGGGVAVSGVLDFEKAAVGPRVVDVARTLAFLYVDCKYKQPEKVRKYFINSGYQKRGRAELVGIELLAPLCEYFWLYDFYKFLKHNPYETLHANEHYQRTVEFLLTAGLLRQ